MALGRPSEGLLVATEPGACPGKDGSRPRRMRRVADGSADVIGAAGEPIRVLGVAEVELEIRCCGRDLALPHPQPELTSMLDGLDDAGASLFDMPAVCK